MGLHRLRRRYGDHALITGASDGMGQAFAETLAKHGFNLTLVARRLGRLETLAEAIKAKHDVEVEVLSLDVSTPGAGATLAEIATQNDTGLFIASAGFGTSGPFIETALDAELNMIDVNCRASVEQTHLIARHMVQRGRGGIVLFGSLVGFQGIARAANYAATKAFIQTFAEGLRLELKPQKVDVISCAPGPVQSGFADRADMIMNGALSPSRVPGPTLAALGKRSTARPGLVNKVLSYSLAFLPRAVRSAIVSDVMSKMTAHQQGPRE